jgi:DNA polymerase
LSAGALEALREEAATCTACDLYRRATQTVFGEGPAAAWLMLIGEQPRDREDRAGHPFVGPAGTLLTNALEEAGIARAEAYLTNAVKHFRWRPAGKVRLHQTPTTTEVVACSRWWRAELEVVDPEVVVLLGATAAHAVLGARIRVTRDRGRPLPLPGSRAQAVVTTHPAAVLRMQDDDRDHGFDGLVDDLTLAHDLHTAPTTS